MDRKEFNEYIVCDVYRNSSNIMEKIYNKYINPVTNAAYMFRKMQYMNSHKNIYCKVRTMFLQKRLANKYGILASPNAEIGRYLRFVHPSSIVIGAHVTAGDHLSLYQNTTIGGIHVGDVDKGNQPTIGNNVTLFANSLILGKINIGNDVIVGANSLLMSSAPDGAVCVGSPAKNISKNKDIQRGGTII